MIVERTHYFARPGMAAEVLAIRRRASAVRRDLGLASGRVFTRAAGSDDSAPDVTWECGFADAAAHAADLAARDCPEFEAVRAEMRAVIRDFQRHVWALDDAPLPNGMRPAALDGIAIVPREMTFPAKGGALKGYLFTPPGDGPFPCMICNHGSTIEQGTWDVSRPGTAALLASWGIASFVPHRRGYGNSPGVPWREEVTADYGTEDYDRQLVDRLEAESNDVLAALAFVATLSEIDAAHIGVMGSSFGGTNTLLAASKSDRFTCAVNFAGAAMNWARTPMLRAFMTEAALQVTIPLFLIQAENDYSTRPTTELGQALSDAGHTVWSSIYPAFGVTPMEGHLFESRGTQLWAADVHRFLERYL